MALQGIDPDLLFSLDDFIPPHLQRKDTQGPSQDHNEDTGHSADNGTFYKATLVLTDDDTLDSLSPQIERRWIRYDGIGPTDEDGMPFASRSSVDQPRQWYRNMFRVLHQMSDSEDSDSDGGNKPTEHQTQSIYVSSESRLPKDLESDQSKLEDPSRRSQEPTNLKITFKSTIRESPSKAITKSYSPTSPDSTSTRPRSTTQPAKLQGSPRFSSSGTEFTINSNNIHSSNDYTTQSVQALTNHSHMYQENTKPAPLNLSPEHSFHSSQDSGSHAALRVGHKDTSSRQNFSNNGKYSSMESKTFATSPSSSTSREPRRSTTSETVTLFATYKEPARASTNSKASHLLSTSTEPRRSTSSTTSPMFSTSTEPRSSTYTMTSPLSSTTKEPRRSTSSTTSPRYSTSTEPRSSTYSMTSPLSSTTKEPRRSTSSTTSSLFSASTEPRRSTHSTSPLFSSSTEPRRSTTSTSSATSMEARKPTTSTTIPSISISRTPKKSSKFLEQLEIDLREFTDELDKDLDACKQRSDSTQEQCEEILIRRSSYRAEVSPETDSNTKHKASRNNTEEKQVLLPIAKAVVKYDFVAESEKEMSLQRGTTVNVLKKVDKNWLLGEQDGRKGLFPESYARVLSPGQSEAEDTPQLSAIALYDFKADTDAELPLRKGQHVVITKRVDGSWFKGRVEGSGRLGLFPASYVQVKELSQERKEIPKITQSSHTKPVAQVSAGITLKEKPCTVKAPAFSKIEQLNGTLYRVVFSFSPNNPDELQLNVGDIVTVTQHCEDGWYVGVCWRTQQFGSFPGNFVAPYVTT